MSSYAPQLASCGTCGVPLADDQRYCLNCGSRTAEPHVPSPGATPPSPPPAAEGIPVGVVAERDPTPLLALGVLAALALVLVVGVLLGRSGNSGTTQAAAPQIVTVGGTGAGASSGGGGSAANASNTGGGSAVKSEWPKGKDGFTVELGSVKKNGATAASVAAAKSDAKGKGAPDVGVLDSDLYGSLPGGDYVVYSGVFDAKKKATAALKELKGKFPDATVVNVSSSGSGGGGGGGGGGTATPADTNAPGTKSVSGAAAKKAVQDLNRSGAAYEKNLKKKPKTIALPGNPPPKDNKPAGGGSKTDSFG